MTAAELLRRAAGRVQCGWTRRTFARDVNGHDVEYGSAEACQWCAVGAVMREAGARATEVLQLMGGSFRVIQLNDHVWGSAADAAREMMAAADAADRGKAP